MSKHFPEPSASPSSTPSRFKEIETHPYYRALIDKALVPVMQAKKEADGEKKDFIPTQLQKYNIEVFFRSATLFEAVKRLDDIPYFLMNNPQFANMAKHGVTPEDWFVYHYANYRVIATGIYDTALIAVNFLLRIDLPAKKCNNETIRKNPNVCEKKIDILLRELERALECYREERNLYVHRSERPEIKFVDQLKGYRFLKEAKDKGVYKGQLPDQTVVNALFLEQRNIKQRELKAETNIICSAILSLLDIWLPVYLATLDTFEQAA